MSSTLTSQPTESLWFLDNAARIHAEGPNWSLTELRGRPGDTVPLHVHHGEDEVFHVIEGELELFVEGGTFRVGVGEIVVASRGVPHAYRVCSPEPARWLALASETFAQFVRALSRPAESDDLPQPSGPPTPEQVAVLTECAARHGIEILGPPPFTS